ncbi:MAG: hypothetical protein IT314_01790 [Anaerolineales bacterium]|nr:hypothetical protein [Anaerolineales bacterium]
MENDADSSQLVPNYYHRNLPHWQPEGKTFFITFRLVNSLPVSVIRDLQDQQAREEQAIRAAFQGAQQKEELYKLSKKYFGRFDAWLDRCVPESPRWLAEEKVAQIVANELHALDGKRFSLGAYCLMSNHAHVVVDTLGYDFKPDHAGVTAPYPLTDTLKRLKGRTARFCNQALGRRGSFWQDESYDHVVRNEREFENIVLYTLNNPVKAGLVATWEEWKFVYVRRN